MATCYIIQSVYNIVFATIDPQHAVHIRTTSQGEIEGDREIHSEIERDRGRERDNGGLAMTKLRFRERGERWREMERTKRGPTKT